jgi:probable blue pigment (indigoidine) exporter
VWAAALRLGLAAVLLVALTPLVGASLPRGAGFRAAAAFGLLNSGIALPLLYWGETRVPSGITAVLFGTVPLTTALAARAAGLERPSRLKYLAALIALAGVASLVSGQLRQRVPWGPLLAVMAAAFCASLSTIALKRGPRENPIAVNAVAASVGFVVCLAISIVAREAHPLPTRAAAVLPLLYLTLAGSVGAYVLYAFLVNHWPVTRASFISVIVPVVATALGAWVRHEPITVATLAGSGLVLGALLLAIVAERRPRATAAPG